jgi:hypothetical protein
MKKIKGLVATILIAYPLSQATAAIITPVVTTWIGAGSQESALSIQWRDGKSPNAIIFGYRWTSASTTLNDMITAVLAANVGLYARGDLISGGFGNAYYGFGYDTGLNASLSITGAVDDFGDPASQNFIDGFWDMGSGYSGPASSTNATPSASADRYQEGWMDNGYWELFTATSNTTPTAWSSSNAGGVQTLGNETWYTYSLSNTDFTSNIPDLSSLSASVPEPSQIATSILLLLSIPIFFWRRTTKNNIA